jgi:hypothetical protein
MVDDGDDRCEEGTTSQQQWWLAGGERGRLAEEVLHAAFCQLVSFCLLATISSRWS